MSDAVERVRVENQKFRTNPPADGWYGRWKNVLIISTPCASRGNSREQCGLSIRLGHVAVHTSTAALLHLFGEGQCRQGNDRHRPASPLELADTARRLQSVHFRHAHVHQNDVEIRAFDGGNRLRAGCDTVTSWPAARRKELAMSRFIAMSSTTRTCKSTRRFWRGSDAPAAAASRARRRRYPTAAQAGTRSRRPGCRRGQGGLPARSQGGLRRQDRVRALGPRCWMPSRSKSWNRR